AFQQVSKRFGDVVAVDRLDLHIEDREFLVLLGPSGCGKSTLLRMLAGLEDPTEGVISIAGEPVNNVEPKDRDIAMVFQSYALYPHKTVRANIEFPLRPRKVPKEERQKLVEDAAAQLGLTPMLDRKPGQLSGGQRQRVALARAIVRRPVAFLMDEPLSNLDAKLRTQTRAELVELQRRLGTTVVYVTHDQVEAMTMAKRVAVMNEGVLQQVGPPSEVYDRPANLFVARFIGNPPMNTLPGTVDGGTVTVAGGSFPSPMSSAAMPDEVVVGVRPERLELGTEGDAGLQVKLRVVESLGHEQLLVCDTEDGTTVIARLDPDVATPTDGATITLVPDPEHVHLFDAQTTERIG
ncbi:MAG TPA: ABC transporter ATP-binding protein, partial [Acidimicrobiales bacterium]|nr:ABC transporter ATP-binding protein [Acidimicrobiales bacterium]